MRNEKNFKAYLLSVKKYNREDSVKVRHHNKKVREENEQKRRKVLNSTPFDELLNIVSCSMYISEDPIKPSEDWFYQRLLDNKLIKW